MRKELLYILTCVLFTFGCEDEKPNLASVEERREMAIEDLKALLTDPANGWKINYQPTPESGSFLLILKFEEGGDVHIQSDLVAEGGVYYEQTSSYRIDSGLGLELIFETYGVLHYLFELDQASFGAEFEWIFEEDANNSLIFTSKSDLFDQTTIQLEPATASDAQAFSREIAENFDSYTGQSPELFGGVNPSQQLYLSDQNLSVFWSIDLTKRTLQFDLAGTGSHIAEVLEDNYQLLQQSRGYSFANGRLVLNSSVNINTGGHNLSLSEIELLAYSQSGDPLCIEAGERTPFYEINIAGLGAGSLSKNLFNSSGLGFSKQSQSIYSVNVPFIFDDNLTSLAESGSIANKLPNAVAFIMTLGFESDTIPENAVGFLLAYENDATELFLRTFDHSLIGNQLELSLQDMYYHSSTPQPGEQQALIEITNEIFDGGSVYAYDLAIRSLSAFQFYNPCNGYEFVLVR